MSAYEIEEVLKRRFEVDPKQAVTTADSLITRQNGGDFTKQESEITESEQPKKGDIQGQKRVTSTVKNKKVKKSLFLKPFRSTGAWSDDIPIRRSGRKSLKG
jgi:hypothetical protein